MSTLQRQYSDAFASVGRPLSGRDATPAHEILAAEQRLSVRAPEALRQFYLVGGRASDYTDHYDHFLPPADWSLSGGKLTFLAENQAVVLYGVDHAPDTPPDPPVFMTNNQPPYDWYEVCGSTSQFLHVMLHWEGSFGGAMPHTATGLTPANILDVLAQASWALVGQVNEMHAYSKPLRALCYVQWSDGWRVFVGANSETDLGRIGDELGVDLSEEL